MPGLPLLSRVRGAVDALLGRGLDSAGGSGRGPATASLPAPAEEIGAARARASQRAGYLAESSTYGAAFVESVVTNMVGDGPSVRSLHPGQGMRTALEKRWSAFYRGCDAEGLGDLGLVLRRAVRSWTIAGELSSSWRSRAAPFASSSGCCPPSRSKRACIWSCPTATE